MIKKKNTTTTKPHKNRGHPVLVYYYVPISVAMYSYVVISLTNEHSQLNLNTKKSFSCTLCKDENLALAQYLCNSLTHYFFPLILYNTSYAVGSNK